MYTTPTYSYQVIGQKYPVCLNVGELVKSKWILITRKTNMCWAISMSVNLYNILGKSWNIEAKPNHYQSYPFFPPTATEFLAGNMTEENKDYISCPPFGHRIRLKEAVGMASGDFFRRQYSYKSLCDDSLLPLLSYFLEYTTLDHEGEATCDRAQWQKEKCSLILWSAVQPGLL